MTSQNGRHVALKVSLLAAGLLLALGPSAAWAGCPLPGAPGPANGTIGGVLVETIEQADIALNETGQLERYARATERGTLAAGCGSLGALQGRIMVQAESWTPVLDPTVPLLGLGPIAGVIHIYPAGGGASIRGALAGSLDFSPTHPSTATEPNVCPMGCPWVTAKGTWTTTGRNSTSGGFAGLALVPAPCPGDQGLCYYDPTGTLGDLTPLGLAVVPLSDAELIPAPSAKFIITLFQ
jgi:hypothetical protein